MAYIGTNRDKHFFYIAIERKCMNNKEMERLILLVQKRKVEIINI